MKRLDVPPSGHTIPMPEGAKPPRPEGVKPPRTVMKEFKVYLAGPITGLTYQEASLGWRKEFAQMLADGPDGDSFLCYSPMRGKAFLEGVGKLEGHYDGNPMSTRGAITGKDKNDVYTSDVIVANFLESQGNFSVGTAVEFGWADAWSKPVIMVATPDDPHYKHPMLSRIAGWIVSNLEDAAHLTRHLLLPGI